MIWVGVERKGVPDALYRIIVVAEVYSGRWQCRLGVGMPLLCRLVSLLAAVAGQSGMRHWAPFKHNPHHNQRVFH
jgi:hypothetical protein